MYEHDYGKTPPPRFGENAVKLPLDVDRPCLNYYQWNVNVNICSISRKVFNIHEKLEHPPTPEYP